MAAAVQPGFANIETAILVVVANVEVARTVQRRGFREGSAGEGQGIEITVAFVANGDGVGEHVVDPGGIGAARDADEERRDLGV